jgi:hypothetical protein
MDLTQIDVLSLAVYVSMDCLIGLNLVTPTNPSWLRAETPRGAGSTSGQQLFPFPPGGRRLQWGNDQSRIRAILFTRSDKDRRGVPQLLPILILAPMNLEGSWMKGGT